VHVHSATKTHCCTCQPCYPCARPSPIDSAALRCAALQPVVHSKTAREQAAVPADAGAMRRARHAEGLSTPRCGYSGQSPSPLRRGSIQKVPQRMPPAACVAAAAQLWLSTTRRGRCPRGLGAGSMCSCARRSSRRGRVRWTLWHCE
jgi:hypothetical protein